MKGVATAQVRTASTRPPLGEDSMTTFYIKVENLKFSRQENKTNREVKDAVDSASPCTVPLDLTASGMLPSPGP